METQFSIETRQKAEVLFQTEVPLGVGGTFEGPVRQVDGYAQIAILGISDEPFTIEVFEAVNVTPDGAGRFVKTQGTLSSSVVGSQSVISTQVAPFGKFMKMLLTNTGGAMSELSFVAQGRPLP